MVASDRHSGCWSGLKGRIRTLFGHDGADQSDENQRKSRFQVEPLEPRILLSGDPVASELARLVNDAAHAMFVDDHAAVVEQLKTEVVADASHADHDAQSVAISGSHSGDERGVEWPSEWTSPGADAGKESQPAAVANLIADHDTQGVVVSGSHSGNERGVELPSESTRPDADAGRESQRMAIANFVAENDSQGGVVSGSSSLDELRMAVANFVAEHDTVGVVLPGSPLEADLPT